MKYLNKTSLSTLIFAFFLPFFSIIINAQEGRAVQNYTIKEKKFNITKEKKDTRSISPVIGYNPTDKFILGGAYFFYTPKEPGYYLGTKFMGSTNKGFTLSIDYMKLSKTPLTYEIAGTISNFALFYYGMGNNTKVEDETQINVFRYSLEPRLFYKKNQYFSYGPFFDLESMNEKDTYGNPPYKFIG